MAELPDTLGLQSDLKASILMVDDNPANLLALRSLLEVLGQNLVEVRSGEEAVERVQSDDFAVVLLDVLMPGMGGFETARAIRQSERSQYTPVIFLTASDIDRSQMEEGYALGAVDFLVKPILPVAIQAKVRGFVQLFQDKQRTKHEADQLRLLVEGAKDYAIFRLDPQGNVASWNAGAERIKQYRADEIIGQHFSCFYPQDAIDRGWPTHELKVVKAEGRFEDEGWRIRKDGTQFWANVVITALYDEAGTFRGFSKITRDLTERKKSDENARRLVEEATARRVAEENAGLIQEQQEWLRVTLASIGDAVIATDTQGNVTFLNGVARDLTGWTQEDVRGQPLEAVFVIVNEQTRQPVENPVEKVLRDGAIVGLGNHTVLIGKGRTERPIDDSAAPIRDAAGKLIGVVLTFRDVTEQRRIEQEMRQSEARKSAILETALDCIITMDHEGKVVEFNPAAETTFGYRRADVIGQELGDLIIPPALRERHRKGMAHYLSTGEGPVLGKRIEMPALRADGKEIPVELAITRISTAGAPLFTAYLRDITERTTADRYRNARLAVTQVLSQAASVRECAIGVLQNICEVLGWDEGYFWTLDPEAEVLRCLESWHSPDITTPEFEATSRQRTFTRGDGLPGRVWSSGTPVWIPDVMQDANFPRAPIAAREGLHGAFGCPIVVDGLTRGTIEFFSRGIREPDADLLEMMTTVCGQVGQFMERKLAEDQLYQSERELADFFDNATIGLHWVGPDGTILRANQAELNMLGYNREEYVGRHISEFHADEDVISDILERLRAGENLGEYAARLRCKDGSIRDVVIDSSVLRKEGEFVHTRCLTRDITEQKRAEQRFTRFMQHLPGLAWIKDLQGRYIYANDAAKKAFRTPGAELDGRTDDEVFSPATAAQFKQNDQQALSSGVQVVEALEDEDGVVHYSLVNKFPILGSDGQAALIGGMAIDITDQRRAEAALRESEEKLRLLANTIPQLAWMAQPDGYIFWYNRRWYEYTGATPEQMDGWGWQTVHDPETLPKVLERWKGSIATGEPFDMVFPLKGADKQFRPFLTRVNPLRDDEGRILYWFGTNTDISDIKAMEEALRESEQRFRQLADAMPQMVWTARPDGNIDYLNRRWSEFTGLPQTVTNDAWGPLLHADDAPAAHERWAACVQSGAPFEMELRLLDRRQQNYRWHLIRTVAVPNGDGGVARWFGTSTDIHQQKRAEEYSRFLAEASAELAAVVDYESTLQKVANLAVPYFADWSAVDLADDDGNLRRLAVAHQEADKIALVRELMVEYPPDPQSPAGVYAVLRTGKPELVGEITDELLVQQAKDERHLRLVRSLNLKSYICVPLVISGRTLGLLTFATAESGRNYTEPDLALAMDLAHRAAVAIENTQLYQALRDTDRRKDEFLATLAHELRNPLAPVRNALEILKMPRVDSQTIERSREMMERQVQHLVRLVDDLLDVSRVMRGKIELRREKVELATIVARAVETVQPLVDAQGHRLNVRIPAESLLLDGDPVRLVQVVGNLLTNAAKYTEPNGQIWLTGEREGDMAVLRVRDNGIGIAPHTLPRIFELFVQVDHASTKAQGGLGIGLTLVKNLVEMHNGIVQCRSDGLGHGSEFVVRLPLVEQTVEQDHGSGTARQAYQFPPPSGKRLLVVDDNQDAANSLAMLLKLQRHEVRVAYSGMAAMEMIKTYTPDLVFLDIGMPGMDGYEVARRIRQTPGLGDVVLAALTGWGQQEDRRRTAEAGFDHHLVKPPEPKVLESVLTDLTHRKDVASTARRFLIVEDHVGAAKILSILIGKLGPHEVQMAHDGVSAVEKATLFRPEIVLLDLGLPKLDGYAVARRLRECDEGRDVLLVALTGEGDQSKSIEAGFDEHIIKPIGIETLRQLLCHPKLNL